MLFDGVPVAKRFEPNFADKVYARSFMSLFVTSGKANADESNGINYRNYIEGRTLFGFDLTGDFCDDGAHLLSSGSMSIGLTFSAATTVTISAFVYQQKEELLQIDMNSDMIMTGGLM